MNPEMAKVADHMRGLGLAALAHALRHSLYFSPEAQWWADLAVLQAAHSAEILIKARIAEENPFLIFDKFPKRKPESALKLGDLMEAGHTVQYSDLPDRLWATTGIHLPAEEVFARFGRLRNTVQHFSSPPERDLSQETLEFVFKVVDPFIHTCWGLYAVDYNEDDDHYEHIFEPLLKREIRFLVPPGCVGSVEEAMARVQMSTPELDFFSKQLVHLRNAKASNE